MRAWAALYPTPPGSAPGFASTSSRCTWYGRTSPNCHAATAAPAAPRASTSSHRLGAPDTSSAPATMAANTSIVPRSGCNAIRAMGTAASTSASSTPPNPGRRRPSSSSPRGTANASASATLANSDGWNCTPGASTIHEWAPLTRTPSGLSTPASDSSASTYASGTYARSTRRSTRETSHISTSPAPTETACRTSSPWSPSIRVADHTSSSPVPDRARASSVSTRSGGPSDAAHTSGRLPDIVIIAAPSARERPPRSRGRPGRRPPRPCRPGTARRPPCTRGRGRTRRTRRCPGARTTLPSPSSPPRRSSRTGNP